MDRSGFTPQLGKLGGDSLVQAPLVLTDSRANKTPETLGTWRLDLEVAQTSQRHLLKVLGGVVFKISHKPRCQL